jgi:luciferase-like monooxygenase
LTQSLEEWILDLPEVTSAPHRFGGTEFQVHGLEFMHSHGSSYLDIRLSLEDEARVLKERRAEPHRFAPQAGWVTFRIRGEGDVEKAKELVQLAYENAGRKMQAHPETRRESESKGLDRGRRALTCILSQILG